MKNYVSKGNTMPYTTGSSESLTSGELVIAGDMVGCALEAAGPDTETTLQISGVVTVPKAVAAGAIAQGETCYATSAGQITDAASGNTVAGNAFLAAAADATEIQILLNGNSAS